VPDVSSSPCRRSHPAGGAPPHQPACDDPCCLRAKSKRSASGASHFRGYPCDHSRYGPVTRGHPSRWHCRWVSERRFPSALPSKLRGVWLLPRVGIEPRRAHWVEIDQATFPRAPLRSCTVGFPEYSSDLGFPPEAFPTQRRLKRWLAYTPPRVGLPPGSSFKDGSSDPRR